MLPPTGTQFHVPHIIVSSHHSQKKSALLRTFSTPSRTSILFFTPHLYRNLRAFLYLRTVCIFVFPQLPQSISSAPIWERTSGGIKLEKGRARGPEQSIKSSYKNYYPISTTLERGGLKRRGLATAPPLHKIAPGRVAGPVHGPTSGGKDGMFGPWKCDRKPTSLGKGWGGAISVERGEKNLYRGGGVGILTSPPPSHRRCWPS